MVVKSLLVLLAASCVLQLVQGGETLTSGQAITSSGQGAAVQKSWTIVVGKPGASLKVELDRTGDMGDPILQIKKEQEPTLTEEDGRPISDADAWDEQGWNDAMSHMEATIGPDKLSPGKYVVAVYNWEHFWPAATNILGFTLKATIEEPEAEPEPPSTDSDEVKALKATIADLRGQLNASYGDIKPAKGGKKMDPAYRLWYVAGKATCRGKTTITLAGKNGSNTKMDQKNPTCVQKPSNITVRWANAKKPGLKDWVGLYEKEEQDTKKYIIYYWVRAANSTEGSAIFYWKKPANWWKWLSSRLESGMKYNFRFFENAGWEAKSKTPAFEVQDVCGAKPDVSGKDAPKVEKKPKNLAVKLVAGEAEDITSDVPGNTMLPPGTKI